MVGHQACEQKGVFEFVKIKLVMAGHLLAILDMSPSTMTKGAECFTAPSTPSLLWGPVSAPNKTNKQTQPCQPALTPHWDVNRCQDQSTLYYCMSGHPPQPVRDPVKPVEHSDNSRSRIYRVVNENYEPFNHN